MTATATKPRKRSRKPITTRKATPDELDPRTGRERKEDAAKARQAKPARKRRPKPRTKATQAPKPKLAAYEPTWSERAADAQAKEPQRMLDYIDGQLTSGQRSRSDTKMLLERRAEICRQYPADARPVPTRTTTTTEEATMARKPRTTATAEKETTTTKAPAKSNGRKPAAAFTMTKTQAKAIAKRLRDGETMKSIREEFGHSDGSKVRAALREHGYGSKGQDNPEGLTPTEWRAKYGTGEDGNGNEAKATTRKRSKPKAQPEPEPEEDEAEDEAEEETGEETADERRKRLRRERRAAKKAEEAKPKRTRSRKPKTAANPS